MLLSYTWNIFHNDACCFCIFILTFILKYRNIANDEAWKQIQDHIIIHMHTTWGDQTTTTTTTILFQAKNINSYSSFTLTSTCWMKHSFWRNFYMYIVHTMKNWLILLFFPVPARLHVYVYKKGTKQSQKSHNDRKHVHSISLLNYIYSYIRYDTNDVYKE